jgi:hypothetical protein
VGGGGGSLFVIERNIPCRCRILDEFGRLLQNALDGFCRKIGRGVVANLVIVIVFHEGKEEKRK